jgi:PEGA domain
MRLVYTATLSLPLAVVGTALPTALYSVPVHAQAQGSTSPNAREQERTALYKEGLALAEAGRWAEALTKFEGVVAIRSAPRALIALATAQEKLGRFASAKRTYATARADAHATGDEDLTRRADGALTALEPRMARVTIRLPGDVASAQVILDGRLVQPTPQGIELDPGDHLVVVKADGKQPFEQRIQVAEAQKSDVLVRFTSAAEIAPPRPTQAPVSPSGVQSADASSKVPTGALILGGIAVATTAVGVIIRMNGLSDYNDASAGCPDDRCPSPGLASSGNAARDRMLVGTVTAGIGFMGIAGAGLWWTLSETSSRERHVSNSLSIQAGASADACSVRLRGRF